MDEVFRKRRSVRSFLEREIEAEKLAEILGAAGLAPSAGNLKAREVIVVKDSETKKRLAEAAFGQDFLAGAPVVLVFFSVPSRSARKYKKRGRDLYCIQDATIAASFAWLQAVMLGLSCCWVGAFEENQVKDILGIKEDWQPIALLPIGYSAEEKEKR